MKTDDLISMLATNVQPIDQWLAAKRFAVVVLLGLSAATLCVVSLFGVRADLGQAASTIMFWAKAALPLCLLLGTLFALGRLARPGMTVGVGGAWIIVVLVAVWMGALYVLANAEPDTRFALLFGRTWRTCALNIAMLSVPGFLGAFWALRGLASTRPQITGAFCGLFAGALGCLAYCLHCPEMEVPFWAVWYVLGMLIPTVSGFFLGPRLLNW